MLKSTTYLDLGDIADWLKIKWEQVGLAGNAVAQATIQDLHFADAVAPYGPAGNSLKVQLVSGGTAGSEVVTVSGKTVTVQIEDSVSTATQVLAALQASAEALALIVPTITGTAGNAQMASALTSLAGGAYHSLYDARLVRVLSKIMNDACDKVETIIECPVLAREFVEEKDGTNANTIVPDQWPVREITELRIDYNRAFGDTSIIEPSLYFIRGDTDKRKIEGDMSIQVVGQDLVLRDDNEAFILGRLFSGSILGSVMLTYKAGWGLTLEDIPGDIMMATRKLVEFWYYQRENRDLGVTSKGVKGESYTRFSNGIPDEIVEMLDPYKDSALGDHPVPQRNYFGV